MQTVETGLSIQNVISTKEGFTVGCKGKLLIYHFKQASTITVSKNDEDKFTSSLFKRQYHLEDTKEVSTHKYTHTHTHTLTHTHTHTHIHTHTHTHTQGVPEVFLATSVKHTLCVCVCVCVCMFTCV
jgi:hypothetical protein